eukprot:1173758-Ditylum_brightwellii.AAC.1
MCTQKARSLQLFSSPPDNSSNSSSEKRPPVWKERGAKGGKQGVALRRVTGRTHHAQRAQKSSLLTQQSISSLDEEDGHSPSPPHLP